jgi:hypothetical protein
MNIIVYLCRKIISPYNHKRTALCKNIISIFTLPCSEEILNGLWANGTAMLKNKSFHTATSAAKFLKSFR